MMKQHQNKHRQQIVETIYANALVCRGVYPKNMK